MSLPDSETPAAPSNARLGLVLFAIYASLYGAFLVLSAFWPDSMDWLVLPGINLAIAAGLGLIVLAFVMALLYAWLLRGEGEARR